MPSSSAPPATHDLASWRVATALAAETGLDWAAWARGETLCPTTADEMRACGWAVAVHNDYRIGGEAHTFWLFTCGDKATCGEGRTDAIAIAKAFASANGIDPVPAPWDADAYRADAARRGVGPGPMPSLSWTGEDGFGWRVCSGGVSFHDGDPVGEAVAWFNGKSVRFYADSIEHTLDTLARIVTLTTAAKRALP